MAEKTEKHLGKVIKTKHLLFVKLINLCMSCRIDQKREKTQITHIGNKKTVNYCIFINLTTQIRWTNSFKDKKFTKSQAIKKQKTWIVLCLLNKVKLLKKKKKNFTQRKLQAQMSSLVNSIKHIIKNNTNYTQILQKAEDKKNFLTQLTLFSQYYSDIKTRQRYHKKNNKCSSY